MRSNHSVSWEEKRHVIPIREICGRKLGMHAEECFRRYHTMVNFINYKLVINYFLYYTVILHL